MKKIVIALILAIVLTFSATSCAPASSSIQAASAPAYTNDELKTLCSELKDKGLLPAEATTLESDYIGAKEGYRFATSTKYGTVEIYFFDTNNIDKDKVSYYNFAKEKNTVELFGYTYKAYLSKSGKFMLVFANSIEVSTDSETTDSTSEATADSAEKKDYDLLNEFLKY